MMCNTFYVFLIWFANILRISASIFIWDQSVIFFFIEFLHGFVIRVMLASQNELQRISSSIFLKFEKVLILL